MTALLLLVLLFLPATQSPSKELNFPLRMICGTIVYSHEVPKKEPSGEDRYKRKSMRGVPVLLYACEEIVSCCKNLSPIGSLETGRSGNFEFKDVSPGKFWLVIHTNGHDAMMPIRYEPINDSRPLCSDYTLVLNDAGELNWEVVITVN